MSDNYTSDADNKDPVIVKFECFDVELSSCTSEQEKELDTVLPTCYDPT